MGSPTEFGMRLLEAMDRRGMKQVDLARATGIKPTTINNYINGWRESSRNVSRLANALGCSAHWLETGAGQPGWVDGDMESQLIALFRELNADFRHALLVDANKYHAIQHPGRSPANPYGVPTAPTAAPPKPKPAKPSRAR